MRLFSTLFLITAFCFCLIGVAVSAQEKEEVSISGQLLMFDDKTPHVACVVQVVKPSVAGDEPTVVATTLSNESGTYQFTGILPGLYQVRCYILNSYVYYKRLEILQVEAK